MAKFLQCPSTDLGEAPKLSLRENIGVRDRLKRSNERWLEVICRKRVLIFRDELGLIDSERKCSDHDWDINARTRTNWFNIRACDGLSSFEPKVLIWYNLILLNFTSGLTLGFMALWGAILQVCVLKSMANAPRQKLFQPQQCSSPFSCSTFWPFRVVSSYQKAIRYAE